MPLVCRHAVHGEQEMTFDQQKLLKELALLLQSDPLTRIAQLEQRVAELESKLQARRGPGRPRKAA